MRTTSSPVIEAELHAYVDGQLAADRLPTVAAYLAARPEEAARTENWCEQNEMIRLAFARIAQEPLPVSLSLNVSAASRYTAAPVGMIPVARHLPLQAAQVPTVAKTGGPPGFGFVAFLLGLSAAFAFMAVLLLALQAWQPGLLARLVPAPPAIGTAAGR